MNTATKTTKPANYTDEQSAKIKADYTASPTSETVEALAVEMGKSVRSVVAKLSRLGVYKKKAPVTKNGEPVVKKDTVADAIGAVLGLSENDIDSLTKCNKVALKAIFEALNTSQPIAE